MKSEAHGRSDRSGGHFGTRVCGVSVANPIARRTAGSQVEPLCRLLPGFWEKLLIAPQKLFWGKDKACFHFCPGPNCCGFELLGSKEERRGVDKCESTTPTLWEPCERCRLSCGFTSLSDSLRSLKVSHMEKKLGVLSVQRTDTLKFRSAHAAFCARAICGLLILWMGQKSVSVTGLQNLHIVSWCNILSKPRQTLCAWSESAVRRSLLKSAILIRLGCDSPSHELIFFGGCVSVWHAAHVAL